MPPKNCGACQKLVYPMDELKCLDKTWHKSCFRCQACSMTLNMKNYKGYNKQPYCNAHYPTTKFTSVAETPETKRIAQNTKIQSNIKYHAEFEAARGQYTAVVDDPETLRARKNMETISNIAYHGDMVKKVEMENARPGEIESVGTATFVPPPEPEPVRTAPARRQPGSISDYDPMADSRPTYEPKTQSTTVYSSAPNGQEAGAAAPRGEDPVIGQPAPALSPPIAAQRSAAPHVQPEPQPDIPEPQPVIPEPQPVIPEPQPVIPEPQMVMPEPAPVIPEPAPVIPESAPVIPEPQPVIPEPQPVIPEPASVAPAAPDQGPVYVALYDYDAADDDEVSFREGDRIINSEPIDEGWMMGTVERTGQYGMLPSNYVDSA